MNKLLEKKVAIRNLIKEKSPFCEEETTRILNKFFEKIPNSAETLINRYHFDKVEVLDVGCLYGQTLLYWGEGSEGVDIYEPSVKFLRSLGVGAYTLNVEDGFDKLGGRQYEAIYCSNLIEHLVAPHLFLIRLNILLKPRGILAIGVPTMPYFISAIWKIFGFKGWLAKEHINFFTFKTIKLTLERSGFEVLECWSPGLYKFSHFLSRFGVRLMPHCLFICRKMENFRYSAAKDLNSSPSWAPELNKFN